VCKRDRYPAIKKGRKRKNNMYNERKRMGKRVINNGPIHAVPVLLNQPANQPVNRVRK